MRHKRLLRLISGVTRCMQILLSLSKGMLQIARRTNHKGLRKIIKLLHLLLPIIDGGTSICLYCVGLLHASAISFLSSLSNTCLQTYTW